VGIDDAAAGKKRHRLDRGAVNSLASDGKQHQVIALQCLHLLIHVIPRHTGCMMAAHSKGRH